MLKYNDLYWMNKAYKLALKAKKNNEIPIGSILMFKDKIISKSYNKSIQKNDPTAHSEINVIRNSCKILKNNYLLNTTLYVTLEPCIMCIGAILNSKIEKIVFGASCNKLGSINFLMNTLNNLGYDHKIKITSGILKKKCSQILRNFFLK
ncbi:tRNA adenosine(34) deaminase TadA [Enterobacteriaceae bacterium ET-AT1-13]|nr:tRNA adenosine(34) deaminase TadA [Enterobacteriaceae bacterium ET-AT1-13]WGS66389.1 tRNA adenosine(34) deaminase TadA [Enterobacteriaceae bacterium Cmel17]WMC17415.1 MAG: tRNA adenosine(34) deaminase TadA [Enterobacteriaceae bacterium Cmel21]WMC17621.1 MAG: tRNA adenosine(34) deaminase TadA [Enterobacteriaceae bacterium PSmelAO3-2]WMC17826.1 MAG: tRNA adenosine(34) deaminase TadA [Enterobacteriaceae bacterium PSmelAO3-1]WMC18029.1 MAG: tRNA adenosine(34) deaminase TadA [Enterobacteriaceae 